MIYNSYCAELLKNDHLLQTSLAIYWARKRKVQKMSYTAHRDSQDNMEVTSIRYQDTSVGNQDTFLRQSETHSTKNPWAVEASAEYHNWWYSHPTYGSRLKLCSVTVTRMHYIEPRSLGQKNLWFHGYIIIISITIA